MLADTEVMRKTGSTLTLLDRLDSDLEHSVDLDRAVPRFLFILFSLMHDVRRLDHYPVINRNLTFKSRLN